jgi:enoyl-CoA hydratase/carnithine racemase
MAGRVVVEKRGKVGFVVFDQQERHNALTQQMWREIPAAAAQLDADEEVRVVVLRGAGEAAFIAGADISEFERNRTGENVQEYDVDNARAYVALTGIGKPVIAMIHGYCVGGGVAIALTADMRYAADDARLGIPAARLGLGYGMAGIESLAQLVGYSHAKEIFFSAKRFSADVALRMGLLNAVFPKDRLETEVMALCETIAQNAPLTLRAVKLAVRELQKPATSRDFEAVKQAIAACYASDDYREGVAAFMQKRAPKFTGR